MINENTMVRFRHVKNARGYPLTGLVVDTDGVVATVNAFGLGGTGTETNVNDVPLEDLEAIAEKGESDSE